MLFQYLYILLLCTLLQTQLPMEVMFRHLLNLNHVIILHYGNFCNKCKKYMQVYLNTPHWEAVKIINRSCERVLTGSLKFSVISLPLYIIFEESIWQSEFLHLAVGGLIALFLASVPYGKINWWRPFPVLWNLLYYILKNIFFFLWDWLFVYVHYFLTGSKFTGRICPSMFSLRHWKKFKTTVSYKNLSLSSINQKRNKFLSNMWQQETHTITVSLSFLISLLIYLFNMPGTLSKTDHYIYFYTDHSKKSIAFFSSVLSHKLNSISCLTHCIVKYLTIQFMNTLMLSLHFNISTE